MSNDTSSESGLATKLLAQLAETPWEHGFYQAMRRLEAQYRDRPRFGDSVRPAQDAVRLAQEPSVVFAPATLAALEPEQDGPAQDHRAARLLVHFFGLFGPDGALPLHLTDTPATGGATIATRPFSASPTSSTIALCRCSIAPGPMPGRPSASIVRNRTASHSMSAR